MHFFSELIQRFSHHVQKIRHVIVPKIPHIIVSNFVFLQQSVKILGSFLSKQRQKFRSEPCFRLRHKLRK